MGSERRWLPVLLVVVLVLGVASSGGAQVDPADPSAPSVWGASCVAPGSSELVVYGRGFVPTTVALEATDESGAVVGRATATAVERPGAQAVFQTRFTLSVPADASTLVLVGSQSGRRDEHAITVSTSCAPTISATGSTACTVAGGPVAITVTVDGAPPAAFDLVLHHVDLFGPAEAVDRSQPDRPNGDFSLVLSAPNVPGRVVPVTVEARRAGGGFAYATTRVTLPTACATTTTAAPATTTTAPITQAPSTTTMPATTAPPATILPPVPQPGFDDVGPVTMSVSPALGRPGEATTVSGRGFAASATLTLRWRPGIGEWKVTTGGDGSFRTQVLVLPKDIEGPRMLEVLEGGAPPVPYLVVPASDQPAFGGVFVRG